MKYFRNHWYDIGGALGLIILFFLYVYHKELSNYQLIMWLSLVSLFFHQIEEYRIVGTFPGMINRTLFDSPSPDRYPLNSNTSLIINVWIGWSLYLIAAIINEKCIWLGIASILVSLGNIIAHILLFNLKGKTFFNAGIVTSCILFAPCVFFYFQIVFQEKLATPTDYAIGIILGILINYFGIVKLITWLADRNTNYYFEKRQLLPRDRFIF